MPSSHTAHVIVVGNEKGGSGKSTIALHLAIGLMQLGFQVAVADLDTRQRSLSRYLENRGADGGRAVRLPCPRAFALPPDAEAAAEGNGLADGLRALAGQSDFLVIDTPGAATPLSRIAHRFADTLITPMNDSLIDLDVLARVAPGSTQVLGPSHYSLLVLEQRRRRLKEHGAGLDWIVLRNRLAPLASANATRVGSFLDALGPKLGFRLAPGISERVIFREMFLTGATVLDGESIAAARLNRSHIAARVEVRRLFHALWLPQLDRALLGASNPWKAAVAGDGPRRAAF